MKRKEFINKYSLTCFRSIFNIDEVQLGWNGFYLYQYNTIFQKWQLMDKWAIGSMLDMLTDNQGCHYSMIYEVFSYNDLVEKLISRADLINVD